MQGVFKKQNNIGLDATGDDSSWRFAWALSFWLLSRIIPMFLLGFVAVLHCSEGEEWALRASRLRGAECSFAIS